MLTRWNRCCCYEYSTSYSLSEKYVSTINSSSSKGNLTSYLPQFTPSLFHNSVNRNFLKTYPNWYLTLLQWLIWMMKNKKYFSWMCANNQSSCIVIYAGTTTYWSCQFRRSKQLFCFIDILKDYLTRCVPRISLMSGCELVCWLNNILCLMKFAPSTQVLLLIKIWTFLLLFTWQPCSISWRLFH